MFKWEKGRASGQLWSHADPAWWHDARSVSTVYVYKLVQNNEKKAWISNGLKFSEVLHRWLDYWTRLPAIILMPCALETRRAIVPQLRQLTHCLLHSSFNSMRRQNDSWESCPGGPVIDPSVEHSRKLKTITNPGWTCIHVRNVDTVDIEHVISVHTWSKPPRLSLSNAWT